MAAKYGLVYRSRVLGETSISVLGPEANELLLFDRANCSPRPMVGKPSWAGCFRAA
jgi:hypothetical protein